MDKITKYCLLIIIVVNAFGCASDTYYKQKARNNFIQFPLEKREKERERCSQLKLSFCYLYQEPTPEELERLKNERK